MSAESASTGTSAGLQQTLQEYADLEQRLADPTLYDDPASARRLTRRHAQLGPVVAAARRVSSLQEDLAAAQEMGAEDPELAAEAEELAAALEEARADLEDLLAPRDPDDPRDVILDIRAGAGGEESALFAAEMLRMYRSYAESKGWRLEVLSSSLSDLGGVREVTCAISASQAAADGVWSFLKHEAGVHRVQRVPVTESAGRIHTSAVGVLVMPEADETDEAELLGEAMAPANLRIDVFRSSGPGGQSVNTTDSAVRITHLPTGTVVSCQDEKSQLQNREQALRILRSRLLEAYRREQEEKAAAHRQSQVRTVDRSERIRTYNFPESRVADHRTGYKANNLSQVLGGDLEAVIASCRERERQLRLDSSGDPGAGR